MHKWYLIYFFIHRLVRFLSHFFRSFNSYPAIRGIFLVWLNLSTVLFLFFASLFVWLVYFEHQCVSLVGSVVRGRDSNLSWGCRHIFFLLPLIAKLFLSFFIYLFIRSLFVLQSEFDRSLIYSARNSFNLLGQVVFIYCSCILVCFFICLSCLCSTPVYMLLSGLSTGLVNQGSRV